MTSLARRHQQRVLAARRQALAADVTRAAIEAAATPYELLRARLGVVLAELKNIQSIEAKIERKREILPEFEAWCEGVLDASRSPDFKPTEDDIFTQVLVWKLDVGQFDHALDMAELVLRHSLPLPERFKRTAATMVAEEIADAALKATAQGEAFPLEILQKAHALTARDDMPDQARAKLHKAIGLELARHAEGLSDDDRSTRRAAVDAALEALKRALSLNKNVGVKKEIERLEREAKRLASPTS